MDQNNDFNYQFEALAHYKEFHNNFSKKIFVKIATHI